MAVDVPMRFEDERLLWVVDDVYTASECADFAALIERSSPSLATNNPLYRDQDRVIRDDPAIAEELFRRLRPHLPERMGSLRLARLNERLRFYRYRAGQRFEPHMDHWYRPSDHEITLHTVLAYSTTTSWAARRRSRSSSRRSSPRSADASRFSSTSSVTKAAPSSRDRNTRCAPT